MIDNQYLEFLLNKYSGNLPRYTSYPTALELKPSVDITEVTDALKSAVAKDLSLYIHTPFCPSLCYFCACNKIITQDHSKIGEYLTLLQAETELLEKLVGQRFSLSQLHIGGGSPSYLAAADIKHLIRTINSHFEIKPDAEMSIEVDPRTINSEKIELLAASGFNRVSLGVQDFDPAVQEIVHRLQPFEMVAKVVSELRAMGLEEINFDLIYGLPGQTLESFAATLNKVIELRPMRVAMYGYAHVTWIHKVQNVFDKHPLPSPFERIRLFELAEETFKNAGYQFLGLDHFVLPNDELALAQKEGRLRRNFMGYTVIPASGILGLGVSSISDLGGLLFQNHVELDHYRSALQEGRLPIAKQCKRSLEALIRSEIIEKIMCYRSVNLQSIRSKFRSYREVDQILSKGRENLHNFLTDGLAVFKEDELSATPSGSYFLRHLASCFDPNVSMERAPRRFSQSI